MPDTDQSAASAPQGLLADLRSFAGNALGLFFARAGLAALELGEARDALIRMLLLSACGLLLAGFALVLWTALLIYLAWNSMGWTVLLLLALLYTVVAGLFLRSARRIFDQGKLGLPATMAELRADREALFE